MLPCRDRARRAGGRGLPRGGTPGEVAVGMRAGPGWLPAGRSRQTPPKPTPLPLEPFHSAAPKRVGGRGRRLQNPQVSWQRQSSLRVKENFGGGSVSGARLTGTVNHGLPFPSFPSPSPSFLPSFLLSLPRGTDTRTCTGRAGSSLKPPRARGCPACLALLLRGRGGRRGALPSHDSSSSSPCARSSSGWGSRTVLPAAARWGRRGKPSLESARRRAGRAPVPEEVGSTAGVAPSKLPRGRVGRRGRSGGVEVGACLGIASRTGAPGKEGCCRRRAPAWQPLVLPRREDREDTDGNRCGAIGRLPGWTRRHSPSRCRQPRARCAADAGEGAPGRGGGRDRFGRHRAAPRSASRGRGNRTSRLTTALVVLWEQHGAVVGFLSGQYCDLAV